MVRNKRKRTVVIVISIVSALLILVIAGIVIKAIGSNSKDPYVKNSQNTESSKETPAPSDTTPSKDSDQPASKPDDTSTQPNVDPATLASIDIAPMSITVSYVKGVGGFEYEVLRAQNGTRYVQFTSPDLVGTKCTNDTGVFVSILAGPTDSEKATLSKVVKVGDTDYGLSLADPTCSPDTAKLQKYQKSFSDGFSALKKLN